MSGPLNHQPAFVLRQALVDLGLGVDPIVGSGSPPDWQVFARKEPPGPDNVLTVYNTAGRDLGRTAPDMRRAERYGIQVRVRASSGPLGGARAASVALALDGICRLGLAVEGVGYIIGTFARSGWVNDLGTDSPTTGRSLFTINGLMSLWKT